MSRIGIFGGTFDPMHIGHLFIANEFIRKLNLDKVIIVPAFISPHKIDVNTLFPTEIRLEIIKKSIADNNKFILDDFEIKNNTPSYTINTINYIKEQYPNSNLYLLIGTDQLKNFHNWHKYEEILKMTTLIIARRHTDEKNINENINYIELNNGYIDISATDIREKIKNNGDITKWIHQNAIETINNYVLTNDIIG